MNRHRVWIVGFGLLVVLAVGFWLILVQHSQLQHLQHEVATMGSTSARPQDAPSTTLSTLPQTVITRVKPLPTTTQVPVTASITPSFGTDTGGGLATNEGIEIDASVNSVPPGTGSLTLIPPRQITVDWMPNSDWPSGGLAFTTAMIISTGYCGLAPFTPATPASDAWCFGTPIPGRYTFTLRWRGINRGMTSRSVTINVGGPDITHGYPNLANPSQPCQLPGCLSPSG